MSNKRPITYIAPDTNTMQRFVQMVGSQLTTSNSVKLQEQEIMGGLAQFLVFLAQYEANRRNTHRTIDESNEEQI